MVPSGSLAITVTSAVSPGCTTTEAGSMESIIGGLFSLTVTVNVPVAVLPFDSAWTVMVCVAVVNAAPGVMLMVSVPVSVSVIVTKVRVLPTREIVGVVPSGSEAITVTLVVVPARSVTIFGVMESITGGMFSLTVTANVPVAVLPFDSAWTVIMCVAVVNVAPGVMLMISVPLLVSVMVTKLGLSMREIVGVVPSGSESHYYYLGCCSGSECNCVRGYRVYHRRSVYGGGGVVFLASREHEESEDDRG